MLNSLQPVKRATNPDDSQHSPTINLSSSTRASNHATSSRAQSSSKLPSRAAKRRKLDSEAVTPNTTTRPNAASRASNKGNHSARPQVALNTIDRYFTLSSDPPDTETESDVPPEKPADSLYDTIQKRVHDAEAKSEDKRTLRSHDESSKLKSDLAVYFPNYDEIINDLPRERELLTASTVLVFKDGVKRDGSGQTNGLQQNNQRAEKHEGRVTGHPSAGGPQKSDAARLNGHETVDFSDLEKSVLHHPQDPLSDSFYFKAHRRAERREKQLRNIEKERAMHEKVQLERLLDGLQGHDWLRVMGVTGVTDSEAQKYQSKRDYFVREVQALVQKFQQWREEEKRLKFDKTAGNSKRAGRPGRHTEEEGDEAQVEAEEEDDVRTSREPSSSEIDASAARQLQLEASGSAKAKVRQRINANVAPIVFRPPTPEGPFLSFFSKSHLREAALGNNRHGRGTLAFGLAVPELDEQEFHLPDDYTTPQSLKESARRRRRMKRESLIDSAETK